MSGGPVWHRQGRCWQRWHSWHVDRASDSGNNVNFSFCIRYYMGEFKLHAHSLIHSVLCPENSPAMAVAKPVHKPSVSLSHGGIEIGIHDSPILLLLTFQWWVIQSTRIIIYHDYTVSENMLDAMQRDRSWMYFLPTIIAINDTQAVHPARVRLWIRIRIPEKGCISTLRPNWNWKPERCSIFDIICSIRHISEY